MAITAALRAADKQARHAARELLIYYAAIMERLASICLRSAYKPSRSILPHHAAGCRGARCCPRIRRIVSWQDTCHDMDALIQYYRYLHELN